MLLESPEQRLLEQRLQQNWQLPAAVDLEALPSGMQRLGLSEPVLALLNRRGFGSAEAIEALLDPAEAPDPKEHFPDLGLAVKRLKQACKTNERLAICGDYDADGMTSTALLIGVLQQLGAQPQAAIPSRQADGYGLNVSMVEELAEDGIRLLVTVDNGVSAREALERAQELGLEVIVTDHHTIPEQRPPLSALLHPHCTPEGMPIRRGRDVTHDLIAPPDRLVVINQRLGIVEFELHQMPCDTLLLLGQQRLASDESTRLVELDHKTEPGFQRRVFIGDVVTPVPVGLLQAQRIERVVAGMRELHCLARLNNAVIDMLHELGGHVELPTELPHESNARGAHHGVPELDLATGRKGEARMAHVGRRQ